MKLVVHGEQVELLVDRGLFWISQRTLVLADLDLGKASTFRAAGIPIPEGDMEKDLERVSNLIKKTKAQRCIILGDLLHHRMGMTDHVLAIIEKWLKQLPCPLDLVIGNHDRDFKNVEHSEWNITLHEKQLLKAPFAFMHEPCITEGYYTWAGHLHPQAVWKTRGRSLRFPCFFLQKEVGMLPAFSSFAGGTVINKNNDEDLYVIIGSKILKI